MIPKWAPNLLDIPYKTQLTSSAAGVLAAFLLRDIGVNALATAFQSMVASERFQLAGRAQVLADSVSATTFKVRAGLNSAGTWTLNENFYGETESSWIEVVELVA